MNDTVAAKEELNVVPTTADVFGGRKAQSFERLIDDRESLREMEKQAKEERGFTDNGTRHPGLDDKIRDLLADVKAVLLSDGRKVQVVERAGSETLDVQLLLEAGVPAETIARCRRRGKPSWHILVSRPGKER